jgi:hypothetical protein
VAPELLGNGAVCSTLAEMKTTLGMPLSKKRRRPDASAENSVCPARPSCCVLK